jgi:polyphenol oxidase
MIRKEKGGIEWLEFALFQDFCSMRHYVFLRHGGVSQGSFASLNAGGGSGDLSELVDANREKMRAVLGCSYLVGSAQVHKSRIEVVSLGSLDVARECDGLVTQEADVGLFMKHADCQAAVFYDPIKKVIGCVHAGWRSNVENIYEKMVSLIKDQFQSKAEDLLVGISPSLGPCCAEFIHYQEEFPKSFWDFQVTPYYFNLWEIGRRQLLDSGVLPSHIEIASICTKCNPQDFFSYRREKISGRHATAVFLKK